MPTNYPTSLDNFTNPTANDSLNLPSHSTQHANANDAIEAIEAKLGLGANVMPYAFSAGTATLTGVTAVTMPASRFTQNPLVQITPSFGGSSSNSFYAVILSTGTTSVSMYVVRNDGVLTNGDVHWFAIQMTSAASAG